MAFLEPFLASKAAGLVKSLIVPLAGVAAGVALGIAYEHNAPWGPFPSLRRAETAAGAWKDIAGQNAALAKAWAISYGRSEGLRSLEQGRAVRAVDNAENACSAKVAEARRSAAAIQSIVTKDLPHDQNGCPVRRLVDPDGLRRAILPAGG